MPKPPSLLASFLVIAALLTGQTANPSSGSSTRLLRMPAVSATQIAFAYANNLWVVERAGGKARRLTSFAGQTTNPHFSPDGKWIAFSGEYAGNVDVYIVPSEGGEPKRLTWHPGRDEVQGWTPDGKSIVFNSARDTAAPSAAPRFWTVPAEGGVEEPMALPRGDSEACRSAFRTDVDHDSEVMPISIPN
jgi:tricorn protease